MYVRMCASRIHARISHKRPRVSKGKKGMHAQRRALCLFVCLQTVRPRGWHYCPKLYLAGWHPCRVPLHPSRQPRIATPYLANNGIRVCKWPHLSQWNPCHTSLKLTVIASPAERFFLCHGDACILGVSISKSSSRLGGMWSRCVLFAACPAPQRFTEGMSWKELDSPMPTI